MVGAVVHVLQAAFFHRTKTLAPELAQDYSDSGMKFKLPDRWLLVLENRHSKFGSDRSCG